MRVWPVFVTWLLAFVGIIAFTLIAADLLRAAYPDLSEAELFESLPGLMAGSMAASAALGLTLLGAVRPLEPQSLRLLPGRETGPDLAVAIVGVLALGQALDSLTTLLGLGARGSMAAIRRAIEGTSGPDLFGAVVVIGVLAGIAEELFFRGYMQTRLRARWPAPVAILVTSAAFGLMHLDPLHAVLAFALGAYLGFVSEWCGSTLPAAAAHVVNNAVFTILTATTGAVEGVGLNAALLAAGGVIAIGCVAWLRHALGTRGTA